MISQLEQPNQLHIGLQCRAW